MLLGVVCGENSDRKFEGSSGSLCRSEGEIDLEHLRVFAGKVVEMMMDHEI